MRKLVRRSLLALGIIVCLCLLLSVLGVSMFRAVPDWYRVPAISASERERFASDVENKLIDAQNWAAELRADEVRLARAASEGTTHPATRAAGTKLLALRQEELNALFDKWSRLYNWDAKYSQYVEDPLVILHDGRLI